MKILAINTGSTSTKLAIYVDEKEEWIQSVYHSAEELQPFNHINEQYEYRRTHILKTLEGVCDLTELDAVIGRGGLLRPMKGGVYIVDKRVQYDLWNAEMQHASNLAGLLAAEIASSAHCPAYIADPVVTDELWDIARITGVPELPRKSIFHALNSRAVSRRYAAEHTDQKYEDLNIIVAHMGGGITVSAHHKGQVVDVNDGLNGDGPLSPERAGGVPAMQLVELCYSGKYTFQEMKKKLIGGGGLVAHLGTTNVANIARWAEAGNEEHRLVLDAMLYAVAKQIGAMHVTMRCKTDAIILTGGIAYGNYCVQQLKSWVEGLAPIVVYPGEDEMGALAMNALGALRGELAVQRYNPQ